MPAPIACGMMGAIAGLFGGGLNQCFPVWVGAVTGSSLGCTISLLICLINPPTVVPVTVEPVVIQNIYIMTGSGKN